MILEYIQTRSHNVIIDDIVPTVEIKIEENINISNVNVGSSQSIEVCNQTKYQDKWIK